MLPFCKKAQNPHRDIELTNPKFDKKLENMLQFSVPLYSVDELNKDLDKVFIVDAREEAEYQVSHIPGATFGGYDHFNPAQFESLDKETPIVFYCSVGYRSEKAAEKMKAAGYKNVFNLYGSIFEWANKGYPLISGDGTTTNRVHTYNKKWGQWVTSDKIEKVN